jgi:hypothetical protein
LARGLPRISRALLAQRLVGLERGRLNLRTALRDGRVELNGAAPLRRAFPTH